MIPELFFEYESYYNDGQSLCNDHGVKVKQFKFTDNEGVEHSFVSGTDHTYYLVRDNSSLVFMARSSSESNVVSQSIDLTLIPESQYQLPLRTMENGEYNGLGCYIVKSSSNPIILIDENWNELGYYLYFSKDGLIVRSEFNPVDNNSVLAEFTNPTCSPSNVTTPFVGYAFKAKYQLFGEGVDDELAWSTKGVFGSSFDVLVNEVGDDFEDLWGADLRKTYKFSFTTESEMGGNFNICSSICCKIDQDVVDNTSLGISDGSLLGSLVLSGSNGYQYKNEEFIELAFSADNNGTVEYENNNEGVLFVNGPCTYSEQNNTLVSGRVLRNNVTLKDGTYSCFVRCSHNHNWYAPRWYYNSYVNEWLREGSDFSGNYPELHTDYYALKYYQIIVDSSDNVAPIKIKIYRPRTFAERLPLKSQNSAYDGGYPDGSTLKSYRQTIGKNFVRIIDENNKILDETYDLVERQWIHEKTLYMKSAEMKLNVLSGGSNLDTWSDWNEATRRFIFEGDTYLYDVQEEDKYEIYINNNPVVDNNYYDTYNGASRIFTLKHNINGNYSDVDTSKLRWLRISKYGTEDRSGFTSDPTTYLFNYSMSNNDSYYNDIYSTTYSSLNIVNSNTGFNDSRTYPAIYARYNENKIYDIIYVSYEHNLVGYALVTIDKAKLALNDDPEQVISIITKQYDESSECLVAGETQYDYISSGNVTTLMSNSIFNNDTLPDMNIYVYPLDSSAGENKIFKVDIGWKDVDYDWAPSTPDEVPTAPALYNPNYYRPDTIYVHGTITKRQLYIDTDTKPTTVQKAYDGTTSLSNAEISIGNILNMPVGYNQPEIIASFVNSPSNKFSTTQVHTGDSVYVEYSVDAGHSNNYLPPESEQVSASIVKKQLTTTTDIVKYYDGTMKIDVPIGTINGLVGNEHLTATITSVQGLRNSLNSIVDNSDPYHLVLSSSIAQEYPIVLHYAFSGDPSIEQNYILTYDEVTNAYIRPLTITNVIPHFTNNSKLYSGTSSFYSCIDKYTIVGYYRHNGVTNPVSFEVVPRSTKHTVITTIDGTLPFAYLHSYADVADTSTSDDPSYATYWIDTRVHDSRKNNDDYANVGEYDGVYTNIVVISRYRNYYTKYGNEPDSVITHDMYQQGSINSTSDYYTAVPLTIEKRQLRMSQTNPTIVKKAYDQNTQADNSMIVVGSLYNALGSENNVVTGETVTIRGTLTSPSGSSPSGYHNNQYLISDVHNSTTLFYVAYSIVEEDNQINYYAPEAEYVQGVITKRPLEIPSYVWIKYYDTTNTWNFSSYDYGILPNDDVTINVSLDNATDSAVGTYTRTVSWSLSGASSINYQTPPTSSRTLTIAEIQKTDFHFVDYETAKIYDGTSNFNQNIKSGVITFDNSLNPTIPNTITIYRFKNDNYTTPYYDSSFHPLVKNGYLIFCEGELSTTNGYEELINLTGRTFAIGTCGMINESDEAINVGTDYSLYYQLVPVFYNSNGVFASSYNYSHFTDGTNTFIEHSPSIALTITPKLLSVEETFVYKTYDQTVSTNNATVHKGNVVGLVSQDRDNITVNVEIVGDFDNPNALFFDNTVPVRYSYVDSDGNSNYYFDPAVTNVKAEVYRARLTISGTTADKYYDGTTNAYPVALSENLSGVFNGDDVSVSASSDTGFPSSDSGTGYSVNVSYRLSGEQANNYVAPDDETITASILKAPVEFIFGSDSYVREYDGTSSFFDTVSDAYIQITNSENLNAYKVEGTNYYRRGQTNEIYKIELNAVDSSEDHNICCDAIKGNNFYNIRLKLTPGLLKNGEPEFYDDPSDFPQFYNNYDCSILTATYLSTPTFKIVPKTLTIGANTPTTVSKIYDGKTLSSENAVVNMGDITGFLDNDEEHVNVTFKNDDSFGPFIDINNLGGNVGTYSFLIHYKIYAESRIFQVVADNYTIIEQEHVTATIDKKQLTLSDLNADKVYDGTTDATINVGSLNGAIDGDDVEVFLVNENTVRFTSPNVGTYTLDAVWNINGADKNNYYIVNDSSICSIQATISPAKITAIHSDISLTTTYDGESIINSFINEYDVTFESGEEITVVRMTNNNSNYDLYVEKGSNENDPNRRVFKIDCFTVDENNNRTSDAKFHLNFESYTVLGTYSNETGQFVPDSSGNYEFTSTYYNSGHVLRMQAPIYITTSSLNKQWDGSVKAYPTFTYSGIIGNDDVVIDMVTTDFESSEIGTESVITVTYSLSGSKADNYSIEGGGTKTLMAEISARQITVSEPYALYE